MCTNAILCSNISCVTFKDKKKKYEPPIPTRVGKKKKKTKGPDAASKLPLGKKTNKRNNKKNEDKKVYLLPSFI